jgi:hypothetical protein
MSLVIWRRRSLVVILGGLTLFGAVVIRPVRFLVEEALPDWWEGLVAAWTRPVAAGRGASLQAPEAVKPVPLVMDREAMSASLPAGFGRILNPWPVWEAVGRLDERVTQSPNLLQGAPREVLEILDAYRGR